MTAELLLQMIVGTTVVVLIGSAASRIGRRASGAFRAAVWRAVLACFWLVPLACLGARMMAVQSYAVSVPMPESWRASEAIPGRASAAARDSQRVPPPSIGAVASSPARASPLLRAPNPFTALVAVWLVGAAVGALFLLRNARGVRRLIRSGSPVGDPSLEDRIAEWSGRLQLRRPPRAYETPEVDGPTVGG